MRGVRGGAREAAEAVCNVRGAHRPLLSTQLRVSPVAALASYIARGGRDVRTPLRMVLRTLRVRNQPRTRVEGQNHAADNAILARS